MTSKNIHPIALGLLAFAFTQNAWADGLVDLQQALVKLNGSEPV